MLLAIAFGMAWIVMPIMALAEAVSEQPVMRIDLTTILVALIDILAAVAIRYAVPWFKSKTTAEQRQKMLSAVNIAVYAAEQLLGPGYGQKKLDQVKVWLQEQGYDIDSTEVITAIEAAVQQLTLEQQKPPDVLKISTIQ